MRTQTGIFAAVFVVIVLAVVSIIIIFSYNGLVNSEKRVEEAQAQIETVLQRRLDLIPNLIETVKAYVRHEKETLLKITQARAQALGVLEGVAKKGGLSKDEILKLQASQGELTTAMRSLFALVENYPDLKASANFMALQDQFEGTENRISASRQRYNLAVRYFNAKIERFPGVFLAPMFGYEEKVFFEAKKEAAEPVKAKF
ncbi:MAG: LemA family protein [Desulfobacterales bacterium]|jgi:LemA protein